MYSGTFYIEFEDVEDLPDVINSFHYNTQNLAIWLYFDNYNDVTYLPEPESRGDYLIVAANRNMRTALDPYVDYKLNQGYNVDVVYLNQHNAVGDVGAIVDLINSNNYYDYPDYVLLVGSLDEIPPYEGSIGDDYPYTDDGYHPMIGRWVISDFTSNYSTLINIINKTISTETQCVNVLSEAVLFSGIDHDRKRVSNKFYKRIEKIRNKSFDLLSIPATIYDGRNPNMSFDEVKDALEREPNFFIYSEHGAQIVDFNSDILTTSIASPYNIIPSGFVVRDYIYIDSIANFNNLIFSMGFGFACSLNSFAVNRSFGAQWVENINGGVSFYSSTVESSRSSNNVLSKRMFVKLNQFTNKKENFPLSLWLYCSEQAYYNALMSADRLEQIKKYNLIGDPTLYVYGLALNEEDIYYSPKGKNSVEFEEIKSINIFDVSGRLIVENAQGNISDILQNLNKGVYLFNVVYENGV